MGGAIIKSLVKGGYQGKITAVDIQLEKLKEFEALGVKTCSDNKKAASDSDIVFIIVKPGDVEKVLNNLELLLDSNLIHEHIHSKLVHEHLHTHKGKHVHEHDAACDLSSTRIELLLARELE